MSQWDPPPQPTHPPNTHTHTHTPTTTTTTTTTKTVNSACYAHNACTHDTNHPFPSSEMYHSFGPTDAHSIIATHSQLIQANSIK